MLREPPSISRLCSSISAGTVARGAAISMPAPGIGSSIQAANHDHHAGCRLGVHKLPGGLVDFWRRSPPPHRPRVRFDCRIDCGRDHHCGPIRRHDLAATFNTVAGQI
jgi:hypothetical protein